MGWIALGRGEGELSGDLGFLQRGEALGKRVGSAVGSVLLGDEALCLSGPVCPGFSFIFKALGSVIPLTSERERPAMGTGVGPSTAGSCLGGKSTPNVPIREQEKPTPLRCCLWGKDAGWLLPGQEFTGKIQAHVPGLEKPLPRDEVDPPPGVLLEMGAECPHACSPTPQECFLPTAGFKHRIFPIWKKKCFFHP